MTDKYKCTGCGDVLDMADMSCGQCNGGHGYEKLRWTKGADGSHWDGCEEVHYDCKIAQLTSDLARLRELLVEAWGIIMDTGNYDPVPYFRVEEFLTKYQSELERK